MSLPRLRPDAVGDLESARAWYDEQRPGLGAEFTEQVDVTLRRVGARPTSFPMVRGRVRRALLRRFPYAVFFVEERAEVVVLAVLHQASDPGRWKRRQRP